MSSFQEVSIGDVCSVGDGAHSKVQRVGEGIPYLTSKNIGQGSLKLDKLDFITEESFEKLFPVNSRATRRPIPGDVLFGIIGTFGNAYLYKENDNFGFSSSIGVLRPDPEVLDSEYLYYVVSSKIFKNNHANHNAGSVQGYTNIPTVKSLSIPLPPLSVQIRIAKSLKSLDDKIQLNRQTNQTLEQIAQAMFKSWFVDFEPTRAKIAAKQTGQNPERAAMAAISGKTLDQLDNLPADTQQQLKTIAALFPDALVDSELGEIPAGWGVGCISALCAKVESGGTPSRNEPLYWDGGDVPWLTSGEVRQAIVIKTNKFITLNGLRNSAAKLWPPLTTVVAMYGATAGQVTFLACETTANQACCALIPKQNAALYVFFKASNSVQVYEGKASGSAQQNLNKSIVSNLEVIIPPEEVLKKFESIGNPLMFKMIENEKENETLSKVRDSLLPKLLSGQFSIG